MFLLCKHVRLTRGFNKLSKLMMMIDDDDDEYWLTQDVLKTGR